MLDWMKESKRMLHFKYAIGIGYIFTILCVLGVASGMEFKDWEHGGEWDWLDWTATMLGGLVGQIAQIATIVLIIYLFF